jgi:hypothetical protein
MSSNVATLPGSDRKTSDPLPAHELRAAHELQAAPSNAASQNPGIKTTGIMSELQSDSLAKTDALAGTDSFTGQGVDVRDDFHYRPIPVLAPLTLAIGFCSIIGLAWVPGLTVPLMGIVLGVLTLLQIRNSRGEYGGFKLTVTGLVLCSTFFLVGSSVHAYIYATEVPEGYERLDFRWLAQQKPIEEDGRLRIADEAKAMDGQKIFVKGYMYPENQQKGLSRFVLCKDTGQCCFGGDPAITDMIAVEFVNDTRADFRNLQLVSVAGTFRAKKIVGKGGKLAAIYSIEGEYFK